MNVGGGKNVTTMMQHGGCARFFNDDCISVKVLKRVHLQPAFVCVHLFSKCSCAFSCVDARAWCVCVCVCLNAFPPRAEC